MTASLFMGSCDYRGIGFGNPEVFSCVRPCTQAHISRVDPVVAAAGPIAKRSSLDWQRE